jgi:hypothetical protein
MKSRSIGTAQVCNIGFAFLAPALPSDLGTTVAFDRLTPIEGSEGRFAARSCLRRIALRMFKTARGLTSANFAVGSNLKEHPLPKQFYLILMVILSDTTGGLNG